MEGAGRDVAITREGEFAQVTVQSQEEREGLELVVACVGVFKLMFPEKTSLRQPKLKRQHGHLKAATQINNFRLRALILPRHT